MALIQDIIPSDKKPAYRPQKKTALPPLTMEVVKRPYYPSRRPVAVQATATGTFQIVPVASSTTAAKASQPRIIGPAITRKFKIPAKLIRIVQYILPVVVVLIAGGGSAAGQAVIVVYFILAVILAISSRVSFKLALVLLVYMPLFGAVGQGGIYDNAAIYAFELLVIGTVQSGLELWRDRE